MKRKMISISLFLAILFTFTLSVFAVDLLSEEISAANNLAKKKIINDHSGDIQNYNLKDNVLRQEVAAIARWVFETWKSKKILALKKTKCDNIFSDVSATKPNTWACYSIEALVDNNLISANKTFRPEDKITKSETIAMLIKAIWFDYQFNSSSTKWWQEQIVDYAVSKGVIKEKFTDYNTDATRWWVFNIADLTIKKDIEEKIEKWIYSDEAL